MKTLEFYGKTVEEALEKAAASSEVGDNSFTFEVAEEAAKGFLGLKTKEAKIIVHVAEGPDEKAVQFLSGVFDEMKFPVEIGCIPNEDGFVLDLSGEDMGILIGRRGQTLDALQYLSNLIANRHATEKVRIVLDTESYRARREEALIRLAERMASKAIRFRQRVPLEPMSAQERRIIHKALQENPDVETLSEGEEPYRQLVIFPKKRVVEKVDYRAKAKKLWEKETPIDENFVADPVPDAKPRDFGVIKLK
jgi:spoIIIJ-associated protein